jgi:hypothetical protein
MMSTNTYASRLRHGLHSSVLGGAAFDTLIDDAELERLERASEKPFSVRTTFIVLPLKTRTLSIHTTTMWQRVHARSAFWAPCLRCHHFGSAMLF